MSDMIPALPPDRTFLRLLAERATANPAYVGWTLREYAESEGLTIRQLLSHLGVAERDQADLMVSIRPVGNRFAEMSRLIAARFGVDELAFATVLRHVEVLAGLRGSRNAAAEAGVLLAARMRDPDHQPARDTATGPAGEIESPVEGSRDSLDRGTRNVRGTGDAGHEG